MNAAASVTPNVEASPDFDTVARSYRWLEYLTFGPALQRCRTHFIPALLDRKRALVLGDGDGRFLAALLAANPRLHADAIDSSRSMLSLLESRCAPHDRRLRTLQADALAAVPTRGCDLVVTHFFLDCLTQPELERLVAQLHQHLSSGALWLISDFRIPAGVMRLPAHALVRSLYLAFRILTGLRTAALPDHAAPLAALGFSLVTEHRSLAGILSTQLWQLRDNTNQPDPGEDNEPPKDPIPPSEPPVPSLDEPDPGVFHHEPGSDAPSDSASCSLHHPATDIFILGKAL